MSWRRYYHHQSGCGRTKHVEGYVNYVNYNKYRSTFEKCLITDFIQPSQVQVASLKQQHSFLLQVIVCVWVQASSCGGTGSSMRTTTVAGMSACGRTQSRARSAS
jgi:hypothetical protein